jgi:site-specific DNA recombinase
MTARRRDVDDRLLSVVKEELLPPGAIVEIQRLVSEVLATASAEGAKRKQSVDARIAELDREIANLVQAIATVGISPALQARLVAAERERAEIDQKTATNIGPPKARADVLARYKRFVVDLQGALARDTMRARAMLQQIFGEIRLVEDGAELYAEYETPLERAVLSVGRALPGRVAGAGFETQLRVPLDAKARRHAAA